jgi:hypothetical protein
MTPKASDEELGWALPTFIFGTDNRSASGGTTDATAFSRKVNREANSGFGLITNPICSSDWKKLTDGGNLGCKPQWMGVSSGQFVKKSACV